jgi:negative regulator of flagellin synthesis FlgM
VSSKISGVDGSSPAAQVGASRAVQRPQDAATGSAQDSGSSGSGSDVQITGAARQLANLEKAIRDVPVVNETRVSQLRTAIEQGTYTVQPQHVADQLTQMEKALSRIPDPPDQPDAEETD